MGTLKFILNGCSFVFVFAALFYLAALIRAKWNRISWRKAPIPWSSFNPFSLVRTNPILLLALIAGLTNIVLSYSLASTEMGAFYEKSEYTQDYEATLDIGENRCSVLLQ